MAEYLDATEPIWPSRMRSVLRVAAALIYLQHGTQKMFGYPGGGVAPEHEYVLFSLSGIAGVIETFGGLLLLVGLFTRPVAFILSGEMAVAYFLRHAPRGFFPIVNRGELAALLSWVFLYFCIAGAGAWSLDAWRAKRGARSRARESLGQVIGES
jgi:putative oxidoreductase